MNPEQTGATLELASRLYNAPLALHPDVLHFLSWCKMDIDDISMWASQNGGGVAPSVGEVHGNVAVIPITGSLMRGAFFSDYDVIGDAFDAAVADSSVSSILLDVDSPGGEVRGMFDLADRIYNARGTKPIIAHANDQMTSAAYALASSADQVVSSATGSIGSIGVVAMHVDQSGAAEKAGLKFTEIASGENKTALTPNRPLSDLGKSVLEKVVSDAANQFFDLVARNRDVPVDAIRSQEAGVFTANEAVELGLADRVASRSTVLGELTNPAATAESSYSVAAESPVPITHGRATEGSHMADASEETTQVIEEAPVAAVEEVEAEASAPEEVEISETELAHAEGRAAGANEAREIIELCTLAGVPAEAATFIAAGEGVEQVRAQLLEAKAVQGESEGINNQVDALSSASSPSAQIDAAAIYQARREIGRRK